MSLEEMRELNRQRNAEIFASFDITKVFPFFFMQFCISAPDVMLFSVSGLFMGTKEENYTEALECTIPVSHAVVRCSFASHSDDYG